MTKNYSKYLPTGKQITVTNINDKTMPTVKINEDGCIVSDNAFHFIPNPRKFIDDCASVLNINAYFLLIDVVVDVDDAKQNTEAYFNNNAHRRFYRVEEVIDFTKDFFRLQSFTREGNAGVFLFQKL